MLALVVPLHPRAAHAVDTQSVRLAVRAEPQQGRCNVLPSREGCHHSYLQPLLVARALGRLVTVSAELTSVEYIQPLLLLHPLDSCVDLATGRTPSHVAAEGGLQPPSRDHLDNHLTESVESRPILKHRMIKLIAI